MRSKHQPSFVFTMVIAFLAIWLNIYPANAEGPPVGMIDEKAQGVMDLFKEISGIPRCSGYEKNIGNWLRKWAKENGCKADNDGAGNVLIRVPATAGYEKAPMIVLQGHMDMVCEKTSDSMHDFSKDAIQWVYEGEWLKADKTTLGADNGIGMALALSMAKDPNVNHPPLELLFTTGEEQGLRGAGALNISLKGKTLINLDSEEEGTLTVGDAGVGSTMISMKWKPEKLSKELGMYTLRVNGLQGGHSGVDIHRNRGNAIKILARALEAIKNNTEIRLIKLKGGSRSNAIPIQAEALMAFSPDRFIDIQKIADDLLKSIRREYETAEKELTITLSPLAADKPGKGCSPEDSSRAIFLLQNLPNGVAGMDLRFKDTVETSNNLGTMESNDESLTIMSLQRSSNTAKLGELTEKIKRIASEAGALTKDLFRSVPWQPNMESEILRRSKEVYQKLYEREPVTSVIHGGLECGSISRKYGGLDVIAIGPTAQGAHSPNEKLFIPSVGKVKEFLAALLASFK